MLFQNVHEVWNSGGSIKQNLGSGCCMVVFSNTLLAVKASSDSTCIVRVRGDSIFHFRWIQRWNFVFIFRINDQGAVFRLVECVQEVPNNVGSAFCMFQRIKIPFHISS